MNAERWVIEFIRQNTNYSPNEILQGISEKKSLATIKRILSKLISDKQVIATGRGKATRYNLSPYHNLFQEIDVDKYYEKEIE